MKWVYPQNYTQMLWVKFIHKIFGVFHRFFQSKMDLSTVLYTNALDKVYARNDFGFPQISPH
jgi:hypothetical protein